MVYSKYTKYVYIYFLNRVLSLNIFRHLEKKAYIQNTKTKTMRIFRHKRPIRTYFSYSIYKILFYPLAR